MISASRSNKIYPTVTIFAGITPGWYISTFTELTRSEALPIMLAIAIYGFGAYMLGKTTREP